MYIAHAGHEHIEQANNLNGQPLLAVGVIALIAGAMAIYLLLDKRRKRAALVISKK